MDEIFKGLLYSCFIILVVCIAYLFVNGMCFSEIFKIIKNSVDRIVDRIFNDPIGRILIIFCIFGILLDFFNSIFRRY